MENYKNHITSCFELIEEKLSRGARQTWDTNDFRALSESIKETTGTLLSVTTLKRLSGNVNYDSRPNNSTLNALAGYVGFKNWSGFIKNGNIVEAEDAISSKKQLRTKYRIPFLLLLLALASSFFLFFGKNGKGGKIPLPKDFSFNAQSVTTGIPNSVVFEYDASMADIDAKIEIQQDWDEGKRVTVDRKDSVSTSIYYRPGFFQSKLVVDNTIVMERDIFIPTQDWLGVIETDSIPIYLETEDIYHNGGLVITPKTLSEFNVNPSISLVAAGFYQVRDFGELYMDDFEMSTSVKNDFKKGVSVCQRVQIMILYQGGMLSLVLGNKGCISELSIYGFNKMIDGQKNDLSGLGVDFEDYAVVKCVSKNQKLDILVNGISAYSFDVPTSKQKIVGITYFFEGTGSLKNVEFKKNREVVYASEF